jgi:8-amino-7-oxononanoate synthase
VEAARGAAAEFGAGAGASPLVVGRSPWHECLETRLAQFEEQESALLFPTGFAANAGTVAALAGREDVVFSDRRNHASLIDGCRSSSAQVQVYDHDRLDQLEKQMSEAAGARRRLLVTDGVFSMDGLLAPLPDLCELARRHGVEVLVDEAHATGVLGRHGRGSAELLGVEDHVAVRVGTLSKAIGSAGGFVAGRRLLVDWLWNRARTQIFSTASPPSACAAACAALDVIEAEPHRREVVLGLANRLRQGIAALRLETVPGGIAPIVPVILREPYAAVTAAGRLEQQGFLVGAMRPPSVPPGTSRLRITVTAVHQSADVDRLLNALERVTAHDD